jgi:3-methyladenine DNA glycosylase/8-oxoguanine DNA glycosylase
VECLFSFICSSNNNIPRITLMLARLRARYGTPIPLYQSSNSVANDSHRGKKRPRTNTGSDDDEVRDKRGKKRTEDRGERKEEGGRLMLLMCVIVCDMAG